MEYQMFLEYVKDHIQDYLPEEYRKAVPQIKVMDSAGGKEKGLRFRRRKGKRQSSPLSGWILRMRA